MNKNARVTVGVERMEKPHDYSKARRPLDHHAAAIFTALRPES
jgi:hypothetical protein